MVAFVRDRNPRAVELEEIAESFLAVGARYDVRGDVAYCQSIIETGWFTFGGGTAVTPGQHNYAGLGVTSKGMKGASFRSVREGVTAQIQHLYAYATTLPIPAGERIVDPRFSLVARGSAPSWEALGGKWAVPGTTYGTDILELHHRLTASGPRRDDDMTPEQAAQLAGLAQTMARLEAAVAGLTRAQAPMTVVTRGDEPRQWSAGAAGMDHVLSPVVGQALRKSGLTDAGLQRLEPEEFDALTDHLGRRWRALDERLGHIEDRLDALTPDEVP